MRAIWVTFAILFAAAPASARDMLPPGFVYLRDVDATIMQDMRYATADNFTGRPLPGYGAAECVLRRETAEALKRVQADLAKENLGLKVYDCYRPTRAVRAMADWAHDDDDSNATKRFYPALAKAQFIQARLYRRAIQTFNRDDRRSHFDQIAGGGRAAL